MGTTEPWPKSTMGGWHSEWNGAAAPVSPRAEPCTADPTRCIRDQHKQPSRRRERAGTNRKATKADTSPKVWAHNPSFRWTRFAGR